MLLFLVGLVILVLVLKYFMGPTPPPIYGVYTQQSRIHILKYYLFYWVLNLRKWQNARKTNVSGQGAGYGMRSRSTPEEMDKAQVLDKSYPKAVDAVYFNGGNADGCYMVFATARRHKGLVQTLTFIRIPGLGLLELPKNPETALYTDKEQEYSVEGLDLKVIEAMKKWKITYSGKLKLTKAAGGTSSLVDVNVDVDWDATTPFFDFDTDLNVEAMADSIAREPWSRKFFANLKEAHQTHHEQFGVMEGKVTVGQDSYDVKVQGVRDHSYGNIREWSDLHRYGIQYAYLEDGTSICVGNICMKPTMTRLIIGYVFHPDGKMDTVSWTDFDLHKMGEDGRDPDDFEFTFAAGPDLYRLKGHVEQCPIFYMGLNWEARIHERMTTYTINGKKGWGISEWEYQMPGAIDIDIAQRLYQDLVAAQESLVVANHLHLLYIVTPYDMAAHVRPSWLVYLDEFALFDDAEQKVASLIGVSECYIVRKLSGQRINKPVDEVVVKRFYLALVLYNLWKQRGIWDVAAKFGQPRGFVQQLLTGASAFASCVLRFCEELEEFWAFQELLKNVVRRLSYCVTAELIPLLEIPGVKIGRARQLYNAGYKSLQSVAFGNVQEMVEAIMHLPRKTAKQIISSAQLLLQEKTESLMEEAKELITMPPDENENLTDKQLLETAAMFDV